MCILLPVFSNFHYHGGKINVMLVVLLFIGAVGAFVFFLNKPKDPCTILYRETGGCPEDRCEVDCGKELFSAGCPLDCVSNPIFLD
jgi:hypothetical protein